MFVLTGIAAAGRPRPGVAAGPQERRLLLLGSAHCGIVQSTEKGWIQPRSIFPSWVRPTIQKRRGKAGSSTYSTCWTPSPWFSFWLRNRSTSAAATGTSALHNKRAINHNEEILPSRCRDKYATRRRKIN